MRTPLCWASGDIMPHATYKVVWGHYRDFLFEKKLRLRQFARWLGLSMPECSGFFLNTFIHLANHVFRFYLTRERPCALTLLCKLD